MSMDKAVSAPADTTNTNSEIEADFSQTNNNSPARIPVEVVGASDVESHAPESTKVEVVVAVVDNPEPVVVNEEQPNVTVEPVAAEESKAIVETSGEAEVNASAEKVDAPVEKVKVKKRKIEAVKAVKVVEMVDSDDSPFDDMGLAPSIVAAVKHSGYTVPTPIQAETIPTVLAGRDLIAQAETGSGKTAAFALPLLSKIDLKVNSPQVLVLAPTRELAIQVTASFEKYGASFKGFRAVTIYGGQSYETQLRAIRRGVHVIVGTPGRMMDHIRQQNLDLSNLTTFVLDEADEMLRMGFIDDVEWIMGNLPTKRQVVLFSATMPSQVRIIAKKYLNEPVHVSIKSKSSTAESIKQSCTIVGGREKFNMLTQILESEPTEGVIVFVKTRNTTVNVADQLSQRGFSAAPLNGEIPQNQRERTVAKLKSGRLDVLVATDVAARGLDVQRISHVINYDFPHDTEAYIHRIGRTGRAGRVGNAILFCEPKEKGKLGRLQRDTNQRIETFKQKSIDEINETRVSNFTQRITDAMGDQGGVKFFKNLVKKYQAESELSMEEIAAGLACMAQGDTPLLLKQLPKRGNERGQERGGKKFEGAMKTFRIEVGREHGVGPGNIVGAITNEANLDNTSIGRINLFDQHSTIDLPADLGQNVLDMLQDVSVSGQRLRISVSTEQSSERPKRRKKNNGSTNFVANRKSSGGNSYDRKTGKPYTGKGGYAGRTENNEYKSRSNSSGGSSHSKSSYSKSSYSKSSYSKPSYSKPSYTKASSSKPSYSKPDDSKPSHSKPSQYKSKTTTGGGEYKPKANAPASPAAKPASKSAYKPKTLGGYKAKPLSELAKSGKPASANKKRAKVNKTNKYVKIRAR